MNQATVRIAARTAAIALLSILVAGCQTETDRHIPVSDTGISSSGLAKTTDSPQKVYNHSDNSSNPVVNTILEDGVSDVPSAQAESSSGTKTAPSAAKSENKWDSSSPKLHGVGIGDAQAATERKLGKPVEKYSIEDENETLTIHEYTGFSIGYGKDKKVRFIEVFDSGTVTDLNGLRIGDTENAAIKALGKPDTHTASVLSYKAAGALLKLDMDPDKNEIISIKLFFMTAPA
ncbi:hypothetical protein PAECIP111893_03942 [Paenibacillus plantiphilus]|uniref:Lipoprotein n=1 Tax=Paenibacillus plantiphilus TaxID=2905650 RepID=A0ABM9CIA2_9BACL|nr:hypothetical protein [Paenibacillus plantiphilus]CAH1215378.1 hypothetical protein PAECIP111893_03942 [Paenibacillus plantiphilus]